MSSKKSTRKRKMFEHAELLGRLRHQKAFRDNAYALKALRETYNPKIEKHVSHIDYKTYLQSREWAIKRLEIFKKRGRNCEACGSRKSLTLHHLSYTKLGQEPDDHLVILCWTCHQQRHPEKRIA